MASCMQSKSSALAASSQEQPVNSPETKWLWTLLVLSWGWATVVRPLQAQAPLPHPTVTLPLRDVRQNAFLHRTGKAIISWRGAQSHYKVFSLEQGLCYRVLLELCLS